MVIDSSNVHCASEGLIIYRQGRRNRTMHLYEVTWPTDLVVLGVTRANAETSHGVRVGDGGCRDVGGSEKFSHGMVRYPTNVRK